MRLKEKSKLLAVGLSILIWIIPAKANPNDDVVIPFGGSSMDYRVELAQCLVDNPGFNYTGSVSEDLADCVAWHIPPTEESSGLKKVIRSCTQVFNQNMESLPEEKRVADLTKAMDDIHHCMIQNLPAKPSESLARR